MGNVQPKKLKQNSDSESKVEKKICLQIILYFLVLTRNIKKINKNILAIEDSKWIRGVRLWAFKI